MLTNFYKSVAAMHSNCASMLKLISCYILMKENFALKLQSQLQNRLQLSQDQLNVYKEYLNALSKNLTLKDCISINLIKTLDEKTRKAIGQNLENFFAVYDKYSVKLAYLSRILPFDFNAVKMQLTHLYETYKTREMTLYSILKDNLIYEIKECLVKLDIGLRAFLDKTFLRHLMPKIDSLVSWLTPNFAIFGIIDLASEDEEEEFNSDNAYYNDLIKAIGTFENEFITKYSMTPTTTRTYVPPSKVETSPLPQKHINAPNIKNARKLIDDEVSIESTSTSESPVVETPELRSDERISSAARDDARDASPNVNKSDEEKILHKLSASKHKRAKNPSSAVESNRSLGTCSTASSSSSKRTTLKSNEFR